MLKKNNPKKISLIVIMIMLFSLTACKPGVYYPFGGPGSEQATVAKADDDGKSDSTPAARPHPVVTTDIIAS